MATDNFCFYLQNRLIQTSQTGGQWYSDTSTFSIPCPQILEQAEKACRVQTLKLILPLHHEKSFTTLISGVPPGETAGHRVQGQTGCRPGKPHKFSTSAK